ncbi:hypothetical protein Tco_0365258 [Tanacetum coccineum]
MAKEGGQKKTTPEADKSKKSTPVKKPAPAKQTKPMKEKSTKHTPSKKASKGKEPVGGVDIREPTSGITRSLLVVEGKGKAIATDEQRRTLVIEEASNRPLAQPKDDTSANIVRDTPFPPDAETGAEAEMSDSEGDTEILNVGEEKGEDVSNTVVLEERTVKLDEGQAGSDPSNTLESRPLLDEDQAGSNHVPSHVALAEPNPESMHEDVIVTFLYDKPTKEEPGKANVETKVDSMVTVPIHQDSTTIPPLSTPVVNLIQPKQVSPPNQEPIFTATTTTTTKTLPPPPPPLQQQSTTDPALAARYINENIKEAIQDALQAPVLECFKEFKKKRHDSDASASQQPQAQTSLAWKSSGTRETPSSSSQHKIDPQSEQPIDDIPIPDDVHISDSKDACTAQLPKIKTRPDWLKPVPEEQRPKTTEPDWVIPPNDLTEPEKNWIGKSNLSKADLEGPTFKVVRPFYENSISLQFQMEECHLLLTDQINLVNPEGNWVVPDLKAAYYQDFGLEELVQSLWIESEREYAISATYVISHWWFKRKEFYITKHCAPSDHCAIRSYMKILSVVSLRTFSRYGYTFLREIILRRADYKEYKISKADFKNNIRMILKTCTCFIFKARSTTYLDLTKLIYLTQSICGLGTSSSENMWKTCNSELRAIRRSSTLQNRVGMLLTFSSKKITPLFPSQGSIPEKLDQMVKDFMLFEFNRGMEHRICSKDDKRRSKELIEVIERRLKIRRIFKSLKSFVSGRLRDVDYKLI